MIRTTALVALAAFAATPLAAQHVHPAAPSSAPRPMGMPGDSGMMMPRMDSMMPMGSLMPMGSMMGMSSMAGMDSMMAPLHALMAYAPQRLLERRAALQLDSEQEGRLVRIAATGQAVHDSALAATTHHRRALASAVAGTDPAAVTAHFLEMHTAMGAAHAAMLRAAAEARAVLTAGQRSIVEAAATHNHGGGS